ncbi:MAG: ABC transporter permease [candidate division Zixibacteria bacterium]|nr:ABC transporter permease [candidate division Zixibacteria bacterium]MBU1470291.1 ABC transporter permease [candidate division Zixibacteria bacterium]MBU2624800.1 ABC transporter permease [candidate division Zixibacteria bacterium]
MKLYLRLAIRNLFRNKRRTFITGTAIGIGLAALIWVDALMIGMEKNLIHSATASFLGDAQIHRDGFRETFEVEKTIGNLDGTLAKLDTEPIVERYTQRVMSFAMITSPANVSAISMVGIDPATEVDLSQIDEAIIEGKYIDGSNLRDILIGAKLAEILEVGLGDRLVMTATEAQTGDLAQEMFRISGIFRFRITDMDKGMVFIDLGKAQDMLGLDHGIHEIAIKFTSSEFGRDKSIPFWSNLSTDENEAFGWADILPQMAAAFELADFSTYLVGLILFGVVALGIINTLFMSLYERMYEFGVMRAVGTRPFAIGRLIVFEAGALAVVSSLIGIILGLAVSIISGQIGIDYTGIEYSGVTFREPLYPVMEVSQYIKFPFWVFVFTTLVSFYPATFAAKLMPAKAMRKSL